MTTLTLAQINSIGLEAERLNGHRIIENIDAKLIDTIVVRQPKGDRHVEVEFRVSEDQNRTAAIRGVACDGKVY